MKAMKKIFALVFCLALMMCGAALAAEKNGETAYPSPVRDVMVTSGEIIAVDGDKITVKGDGSYSIVTAIIGDDTYLVNGKNGKDKKAEALKKGKEVSVYYSSLMTRSYPPQSQAFAVVFGKNEPQQAKYFRVDKVMQAEDGSYVRVLNSNHDIIATIDAKACPEYKTIKAGDELLMWYDIMTMSLPGQTNAKRVIILEHK